MLNDNDVHNVKNGLQDSFAEIDVTDMQIARIKFYDFLCYKKRNGNCCLKIILHL